MTAYPGTSSLLVAPIGEDFFGHVLAEQTARLGMRKDGLVPAHKHTAVCNMVLDPLGTLIGGVSDMNITEDFGPDDVRPQESSPPSLTDEPLPDHSSTRATLTRVCRFRR